MSHWFAEPYHGSVSRIACYKEGCTKPAVGVLTMPYSSELRSRLFVCEEHKGEQVVFVPFQEEHYANANSLGY